MKKYYLNEITNEFNIPSSTIRFYDQKGLLPFVQRDDNKYRYVLEQDLNWFETINCLRQTGMAIENIREYVALAMEGDKTMEARHEIIRRQLLTTEEKMKQMQTELEFLKAKDEYYTNWCGKDCHNTCKIQSKTKKN